MLRHKRELTEGTSKMMRQTEDLSHILSNFDSLRQGLDQHSTILSCLVEFASMEQALAMQDEDDRSQMKLLGKGSGPMQGEASTSNITSPSSGALHSITKLHEQKEEKLISPIKGYKLKNSLRSGAKSLRGLNSPQQQSYEELN